MLKLVSSARSLNGSGTLTVETWEDENGARCTSVGGGEPVMTATAEEMKTKAARAEIVRRAGEAGRAGDWDLYDELVAEARAL